MVIYINIDGTEYEVLDPFTITQTGLNDFNDSVIWTYGGQGTFLGFSTQQGATTPDEELFVGDTFYFDPSYEYLYSVAQTTSTHDISISYKGSTIATTSESGTTTLTTAGKYCEGDITIEYDRPALVSGIVMDEDNYVVLPPEGDVYRTQSLSVTENGAYTPSAGVLYNGVTVSVAGGGAGWETCPESWATGLIDNTLSGAVYGSMVLSVGSYAFANCSALTSVSFPACGIIGEYAFSNCLSLASAHFASCKTIQSSAFYNCVNLYDVYFPECVTISGAAFSYCQNLSVISLPACRLMYGQTFNYCSKLESVYILSNAVPTLRSYNGTFNPFTNTPLADSSYLGKFGSIYVLENMVTAFKASEGWSDIASRIVAYAGGS